MKVAVKLEFKADRKEPLGALVRRVAGEFERHGLAPDLVATFSDGPGGAGSTSAVERALRKHPHLACRPCCRRAILDPDLNLVTAR